MTEPKDYNIDDCFNIKVGETWTVEKAKRQIHNLISRKIIGADKSSDFDHDFGYCQTCEFQPTDGTENCICKMINIRNASQLTKLAHLFNIKETK